MTPAERYLASFPPGTVVEFPVVGLDVLDVPLHSAALPASPRHPGGSGLGYGATPEEARIGALGEMAEMALSTRGLAVLPRVEASYAELVRNEGAGRVQDPRTLALEAGSPYDDDRVLQWLPMTRLRDGEQVLVPAELVASVPDDLPGPPPPDGWLTTVITNGQGAAFHVKQAVAHGALEVLQRDGNATAFRAMDRGVVVDLDGLRDRRPGAARPARPARRGRHRRDGEAGEHRPGGRRRLRRRLLARRVRAGADHGDGVRRGRASRPRHGRPQGVARVRGRPRA